MTYYRFNKSNKEYFDMSFENAEQARDFANRYGYCLLGRTSDSQTGYFEKKSKANIERMMHNDK